MSQLETISSADGLVLAYLVRRAPFPDHTEFLTPHDCALQIGHVVYKGGSEITRHMHLPIERHIVGTTELLIVQQGRCEVDVYDLDRQFVTTRELCAGDMLISVAGGHGFRVLEDIVLFEVKQGPYPGEIEKERF